MKLYTLNWYIIHQDATIHDTPYSFNFIRTWKTRLLVILLYIIIQKFELSTIGRSV